MSYHPDDRPEPFEQPIRARVPERVAGGCFSTGVIVMTAQTEFLLDFVQNLGRPHQIVARVVMPHSVLPQLVDALGRNIQLYRGRWGDLPQPQMGPTVQVAAGGKPGDPLPTNQSGQVPAPPIPPGGEPVNPASPPVPPEATAAPKNTEVLGNPEPSVHRPSLDSGSGSDPENRVQTGGTHSDATQPGSTTHGTSHGVRQATAQEIYDDLKIRDELLSGVYANAVMIGHGPHEFSFDFITNFYPHSAVSARVFLAAGQIPRLYDSLKGTWDQLRMRLQPPPENPPPGWVV